MDRLSVALGLVVFLMLGPGSVAVAHGERTIELGSDRVQPGGAVEVRADLGSGEMFEIALISKDDGSRRVISTVPATEDGHFHGYVTVPADVLPGDYLVEASADLAVARVQLTVAGAPIADGLGGGPEREGFAPAVASQGGAGAGEPSARSAGGAAPAASATAPRDGVQGLAIMASAGLVAIVLVTGLRLGHRASRSRP